MAGPVIKCQGILATCVGGVVEFPSVLFIVPALSPTSHPARPRQRQKRRTGVSAPDVQITAGRLDIAGGKVI